MTWERINIFLLVIFKICFCCDNPDELSIMEPFKNVRNIQSFTGDDLNIVCCHPDGHKSLSWQDKTNKEIFYNNNNGVYTVKDERNRLILRIENLNSTTAGEYMCIHSQKSLIKPIIISMKSPKMNPEIIKKDLFFPNNKPIVINSSLSANQIFKSWTFTRGKKNVFINKDGQGKGFKVSQDKTIFTIVPDGKQEDIKIVWCHYTEVSSNGEIKTGMYEYTWTLYDPIDVQLILENKGPILESNDVRLICYFRYNDMLSVAFPNNVIMKKNMLINNENLTKGKVVLTITKITKELEGDYECKISKFLSTEPFTVVDESAKVKVDVITPPTIMDSGFVPNTAKLNQELILICYIKSRELKKENVYFEYYRSENSTWNKIFQNDDKYTLNLTMKEISALSLIINKVSWDDRGTYRCVAKNAAGEVSKTSQLKVEKSPELKSSADVLYIASKPVRVECVVSGYPLSPTDNVVELRKLTQSTLLDLNVIDKQNEDFNGLKIVYEVVYKGELTEGSSYKLECYYKNMRTNSVQQKEIELKIAQKPSAPEVNVLCSGSSGIVFKYQVIWSDDKSKRMVKNILSYAPSEDYDSMKVKPTKVIPVKDDEKNEYMIYVLKDLMASRKYTFKWESFNIFGLSNEKTLTYSTKDVMPPKTPKKMEFSTKGNMINVNVSWDDDCPYTGSNSAIRDIAVVMKPVNVEEGKNSNWQWTERNFTLDSDKSSAQFLIFLENPQIDYQIEVALRSPQGTSDPLMSTYKADVVLAGSLFSCFPRCTGTIPRFNLGSVRSLLTLVSFLLLLRFYY